MNAGKRQSASGASSGWIAALRSPRWRIGSLAVLGLTVLIGVVVTWRKVSPEITASPDFALTEAKIAISAPPDWIDPETDIRAEVFRDGSLARINLLDSEAAVQIARAFELHAWVKRVVRVQKQAPGKVLVELEYRRPVALVEVLFNNVLSYEPVDAEGVVLPEDLFHRDEKQLEHYLRITADYSMPSGMLGTPWGDARVSGAARIAALVEKAWQKWNLYRIVALPPDSSSTRCSFELRSRGNSRILWGRAPGEELSGEPSALEKLTRLAKHLQQHGPLDQQNGSAHDIDLRHESGLQVAPRTAQVPRSSPTARER